MSYNGEPDFKLYVFDSCAYPELEFEERYAKLSAFYQQVEDQFPWLVLVEQVIIYNLADLLAYEAKIVGLGYEGIMVRSLTGKYKAGRTTMLQGNLMALKRFVDDEAIVLEYRPELENTNEATEDALGHSKRSGHQENLIPKDRMGTMLCRSLIFDKPFWLGGGRGITHDVRKHIWNNPNDYQWRLAQYVFQEIGVRERPRLPRWKRWRSLYDLDADVAQRLLALGRAHQWSGLGRSALDPRMYPRLGDQ